ncbi:benzoate 4-monooxygenase cytochrome P450 [Ilyonectria destructans]|nr:benzoate 4-monooxygenase cytochrome P450 [Ilyonectria destructans]
MSQFETPAALLAAFAAGVSLHVCVFRIGEWDLWAVRILLFFASLYGLAVVGLLNYFPQNNITLFESIKIVSKLSASLMSGLVGSMLLYRGFFHRLCRFPGPVFARFSNLYPTFLSSKNLHLYDEVRALHQQYGDIVRLGPSELSINSVDALHKIHSSQTTCVKGPWYNILSPRVSLQMIRNKQEHIHRRRVWDRGFSAKALRDYEPRVVDYTDQLLAHFKASEGRPINVTDWFNFYSFDVMGDLAWGKSFNMLQDGVKHYFMKSLHADMTSIGLFSHALWLFPIFKVTPFLNYEHKRFWKWVNAQVAERRAMTPSRPDVFSWILEDHEKKQPTFQDELNLAGDAYVIAVAGSDTTAATLTCLFYELALHPECIPILQEEVDGVFDGPEAPDATTLRKLEYLNAVINETLRLHPPVPSGVQRMTSPEGMTIGDTFIPGNTIVQVPAYALTRDGRYFDRPEEFVPERWTSKPELVKDERAFVPFSTGRYSCIGKQLGLMEIRHVASQILRRYNVALAPGQTPSAFLQGKQDTFTLQLAPLDMVFPLR